MKYTSLHQGIIKNRDIFVSIVEIWEIFFFRSTLRVNRKFICFNNDLETSDVVFYSNSKMLTNMIYDQYKANLLTREIQNLICKTLTFYFN